jgi:trehalose 6-phosphate synthase
MNLVAKEFIAGRSDERDVLVLSQYSGAARQLDRALLMDSGHVQFLLVGSANAGRRGTRLRL